jgi:hypothetical protein
VSRTELPWPAAAAGPLARSVQEPGVVVQTKWLHERVGFTDSDGPSTRCPGGFRRRGVPDACRSHQVELWRLLVGEVVGQRPGALGDELADRGLAAPGQATDGTVGGHRRRVPDHPPPGRHHLERHRVGRRPRLAPPAGMPRTRLHRSSSPARWPLHRLSRAVRQTWLGRLAGRWGHRVSSSSYGPSGPTIPVCRTPSAGPGHTGWSCEHKTSGVEAAAHLRGSKAPPSRWAWPCNVCGVSCIGPTPPCIRPVRFRCLCGTGTSLGHLSRVGEDRRVVPLRTGRPRDSYARGLSSSSAFHLRPSRNPAHAPRLGRFPVSTVGYSGALAHY